MSKDSNRGLRRVSSFTLIGVASTTCHYGVLLLAVEYYHLGAVTASLTGACFGAIVSYVLNGLITFRVSIVGWQQPLRFMAMIALGAVLNTLLMALWVEMLQLQYVAAQMVTTGILFLWNYWLSSRWVFR